MEEIYDMERFTHTLRMQEGHSEGKWEKWKDYRRGEDIPLVMTTGQDRIVAL